MRNAFLILSLLVGLPTIQTIKAQVKDSLQVKDLSGVVVIGRFDFTQKKQKSLATLDSYLETNSQINLLKRGAYAWEPILNGMATERSVITIDGMRIYGACTDKMDPVTSYVEISNLSKASVQSGQAGSIHGATIAGSIDLVRQRAGFGNEGFNSTLFTGWESNNHQKIMGGKVQYSGKQWFGDADFTWRDAQNYQAGGGQTVAYSQFSKYNLSSNLGLKLNEHSQLLASLIYDKASEVGYPALPMDVAKAEAGIFSLQYLRQHLSAHIHRWDNKIYYNQITHLMDDSHRPIVPIRMDMPGWSKTLGFYSQLEGESNKNQWKLNLSGHYNHSLAEMTMFSNIANQPNMYMLTWPGVGTFSSSLFIENKTQLSTHWTGILTATTSIHHNQLANDFGFQSMQIFYPSLQKSKSRWLKSIGYNLYLQQMQWRHQVGLAYSDRAPSVSEGYGFYLFNSMDKYDYVGNPNLKNEQAVQLNAASSWNFPRGIIKAEANYFRMYNYIIGKPDASLLAMTIGASGIKRYLQIPTANLVNFGLSIHYSINERWLSSLKTRFRWGEAENSPLPQIQPFDFEYQLKYQHNTINVEIGVTGATQQQRYAAIYGENPAEEYAVVNLAASKQFRFSAQRFLIKTGIENLLDKRYRTFADWNNIPRMGRNLYLNLIYQYK